MCDTTGGTTRRCNETFSAQFSGIFDVDQPMATTDGHDYVEESVPCNQYLQKIILMNYLIQAVMHQSLIRLKKPNLTKVVLQHPTFLLRIA